MQNNIHEKYNISSIHTFNLRPEYNINDIRFFNDLEEIGDAG